MNYYVFINDNNGHYCEYFNFKSNATRKEILEATEQMKKESPYGRFGSRINHLSEKLTSLGFKVELEDNNPKRIAVDRIRIHCISGNY